MKKILCSALAVCSVGAAFAGAAWRLADDGGIVCENPRQVNDHIEMSSRGTDAIFHWSVSDKGVWARRGDVRFPTLREMRDDTHSSWQIPFVADGREVAVNGAAMSEGEVSRVAIRHSLKVEIAHPQEGLKETREIYPALNARAFLERVTLTNVGKEACAIEVRAFDKYGKVTGKRGDMICRNLVTTPSVRRLASGASTTFVRCTTAREAPDPIYYPDADAELAARRALWDEAHAALVLESPSAEFDEMFGFAKFRTLESLYFTRGGIIHSPGGFYRYLASIWANDQAEYACPFLPYLGSPAADETMKTCFRWFAKKMNKDYHPIPSSIIAEGRSYWNGARDRGDQAMMAHGAARAALALGDKAFAEEMKPFVDWCIEYSRRKMLPEGVIASDADELEHRLPAGKANLCTSSLHYDALLGAANLTDAISGASDESRALRERAKTLEASIEKYFGGTVEGFDAYRYYEGNDKLRSWIAIPLCFGIDRRASAVSAAVFSDKLWDGVGLKSISGNGGYWDRSTLYAFRGLAYVGHVDEVLPRLTAYTHERLLGRHVPYPVEAFPEGSGSHLAAESALYARIFTEGVFGMTPRSLTSFTVRPNLPQAWPRAALRNIRAFGARFDLELAREGADTIVTIKEGGVVTQTHRVAPGGTAIVEL